MAEKKNFFEDLEGVKPESFEEEVFVKRKRSIMPVLIAIILGGSLLAAVYMWNNQNYVSMPEIEGWSITDASLWANDNDMNLVVQTVYSNTIQTDTIISQGIVANERIRKKSSIPVNISSGPDPEAVIPLVDLKSMTKKEIDIWVQENMLTGITYKYENSESYKENDVMSYRLIDGSEDHFLRKHRIEITISEGPKEVTETLSMPDFYGQTREDVVKWSVAEKVQVAFLEEFDDTVGYNQVLAQSITKDTQFIRDEVVTITLSLGAPVEVPQFVGLKSSEADSLASLKDITLLTLTVPSEEEDAVVLSQDRQAGSVMTEKDYVTIYISEKTEIIKVPDMVGLPLEQASELATLYKVSLIKTYEISEEEGDLVLAQNLDPGTVIDNETFVTITLSKGYKKVPDFIGLTKVEAESVASKSGFELVINEVETMDEKNDIVMKQYTNSGELAEAGSSIIIEVAKNSGFLIGDIQGMSRDRAEAYLSSHDVSYTVIEHYSDTYEKGIVYNPNFKDQMLPEGANVVFYCSIGRIMIGDYVEKSLIELIQWQEEVNSKGGDIKILVNYERDMNAEDGQILEQSVVNDVLFLDGSISVKVAYVDYQVMVPNFTGWSESQFVDWCHEQNVPYEIYGKYSDEYNNGIIFKQSMAGLPVPKGEPLIVNVSKGHVYIGDFVGLSRSDLQDFMDEIKVYGGVVNWNIREIETDEVKSGTIIYQSRSSVNLNQGEVVTIDIAVSP